VVGVVVMVEQAAVLVKLQHLGQLPCVCDPTCEPTAGE